jgi:phosphoenolpyruvate carboxykinase (GTP)
VWWEGLTDQPPTHLTDWKGHDWTPSSTEPAAHPNSRFTTPAAQCPIIASEWQDPAGVPIAAILFGGRRASAVPLVVESLSWPHGVFLGACIASEKTAAAEGHIGELRYDPFAMLPFCGYNMGDYLRHWLQIGAHADPAKLPHIYYVNWFGKDTDGSWLWPGYGENSRVLKWIIERLDGQATAVPSAIGNLPTPESFDVSGMDLDDRRRQRRLTIDPPMGPRSGPYQGPPRHLRRPPTPTTMGRIPRPTGPARTRPCHQLIRSASQRYAAGGHTQLLIAATHNPRRTWAQNVAAARR